MPTALSGSAVFDSSSPQTPSAATIHRDFSSRSRATAARRSGDRLYAYVGLGFRAWAESRLGERAAAAATMAQAKAVGSSLGSQLILADLFSIAGLPVPRSIERRLDEACIPIPHAIA